MAGRAQVSAAGSPEKTLAGGRLHWQADELQQQLSVITTSLSSTALMYRDEVLESAAAQSQASGLLQDKGWWV